MTDKELLGIVVINEYVRKVKISNSRLAKYYYQGEKIPIKYQKGLLNGENHWMFIKERRGIVLVDADGDPIVKNPKVAGTPRYKRINGQDLYSTNMHQAERTKIIDAIKAQMRPEIRKLGKIEESNFPIRVLCEVHTTFMDGEYIKKDGQPKELNWDIDNHISIHMKAFPDTLKSEGIIPDDHRGFITQPPVPIFVPIENYEERKLVFKIYKDNREVIKTNKHYNVK